MRYNTKCALRGLLMTGAVLLAAHGVAAGVITFEDLVLDQDSCWNGSERFLASGGEDGAFASGGCTFSNHYDEDWDAPYWDGFAYSNRTYMVGSPVAPPDENENKFLGGQFHAVPGHGADGSANYAMGYAGFYGRVSTIEIPQSARIESAMITNSNYAYFTMLEGDPYGFTLPFGGSDGDTADWLLLTITGKGLDQGVISSVKFYLGDYRFTDNSQDYLVDTWTRVDLSSLATARYLEFTVTGSDNDPTYGLNTPAYFALDNIQYTTVPEPSPGALLACGVFATVAALFPRRRAAALGSRLLIPR